MPVHIASETRQQTEGALQEHFKRFVDLNVIDPTSSTAPLALRCRRLQLCLSQEQLGGMVGSSADFINALELGKEVAVHSMWQRIANSICGGNQSCFSPVT